MTMGIVVWCALWGLSHALPRCVMPPELPQLPPSIPPLVVACRRAPPPLPPEKVSDVPMCGILGGGIDQSQFLILRHVSGGDTEEIKRAMH